MHMGDWRKGWVAAWKAECLAGWQGDSEMIGKVNALMVGLIDYELYSYIGHIHN